MFSTDFQGAESSWSSETGFGQFWGGGLLTTVDLITKARKHENTKGNFLGAKG
jgi:hypothetical protein